MGRAHVTAGAFGSRSQNTGLSTTGRSNTGRNTSEYRP